MEDVSENDNSDSEESDAEHSDDSEDLVQEQDSDAEEGDEYHMEKLRQYQLNRLKYYYAVVVCDSVATADKIYAECDGIEYESSATKVDLRFIPDDTSFDEDVPKEVCTELPDTNSYKPRQFTTTALQQAKVDLTWDETEVERKELGDKLSSGKLDELTDKDLRKIVAYSSEEEEEEDEEELQEDQATEDSEKEEEKEVKPLSESKTKSKKNKKTETINKYKALLAEINQKEQEEKSKKYEMEYSWNVSESLQPKEEKNDSDLPQKSNSQMTPIEKVLAKRSEKNKKRKEERRKKKQGKFANSDQDDSDSDSLPEGINMNDPYFAEEFANGDFEEAGSKKQKKKSKKLNQQEKEQQELEAAEKAKELQLLLDDDNEEEAGKQHFSLEKILKAEQGNKKKKRKQLKKSKKDLDQQVQDTFQLNVDDERFKAVYDSHVFNIDPTDSHFKKTKGMELIIQEKLKRRHGDNTTKSKETASNSADNEEDNSFAAKRPKKQIETSMLVKSLKRKIQMQQH